MNDLLKKVKDIYQEGCVSIILRTNRSRPENKRDPISLKNLVKEAEERLNREFDKRLVWSIMEKIQENAASIDHSMNLESLVLYANRDFSDFTRLPVQVENRVVIDNTFATRDLVRAMHQESSYYVLVLSRHKARLIEAYNDSVVREVDGDFPYEDYLYTTSKSKQSTSSRDNLIEEFFNRVDKIVLRRISEDPHPVVLATEKRNYDHYMNVADKKELILGFINRNRDDEKAGDVVRDAWKEVREMNRNRNRERIMELNHAVGQNRFESDYNNIWKAIREGRGKTLFVKRGFFQPSLLQDNVITPVDAIDKDLPGIVDDIVDEMIEKNMAFGGDTVFVEGDELSRFQNIALITRY